MNVLPVVILLICIAYAIGYSNGTNNRGGPK